MTQEFESQFVNKILCGDALATLPEIPNGVINCSISSPPYWSLRDYGWNTCTMFGSQDDFVLPKKKKKRNRWWIMIRWRAHLRGGVFSPNKKSWIGALGLEPTFELYIRHLCTIYDEVKRVLRPDGTCWVNLGDTYAGGGRGWEYWTGDEKQSTNTGSAIPKCPETPGVQAKSLCLIPQRFAIEMVNRGWILRNVIIWSKPNPMPSSAKDRFTVDFEYVFFFVKSKRYFFVPQYEAQSPTSHPRFAKDAESPPTARPDSKEITGPGYENWREYTPTHILPLGRNKRTTWVIPTQPTPEAHFATFPEELVRPMVKAGCPRYVCKKCGKARERVYEDNSPKDKSQWPTGWGGRGYKGEKHTGAHTHDITNRLFKGYTDCGCNAGFKAGIVLDPFVERAEPARSRPRKEWTIAA